jgi:putative RNA 2'-phosphotransferase
MGRGSHTRTSKWLSWALRHAPDAAGITLDPQGWADVEAVVAAARRAGLPLDTGGLEAAMAAGSKGRFTMDGERIRATHGHSVPIDLGLRPLAPPAVLYHGTAERFLEAIRRDGLTPRARTHVHLSADIATARSVGARHGRPVVLEVDAGAMAAAGHEFLRSAGGVWLVPAVPAAFLRVPS